MYVFGTGPVPMTLNLCPHADAAICGAISEGRPAGHFVELEKYAYDNAGSSGPRPCSGKNSASPRCWWTEIGHRESIAERTTYDDRPIPTGRAFDQRAIREMSLAFESVYNGLGVRDDDEANRRLVAEKIIELAGHGMQGATLRAATIKEVNAMSDDNVQKPAQSLSCSNCGHAVPLPAASTSDDTLVICPACGADLGRWGDVKES
jgi:DNA-directed RNA polymerase subunit RPC12/RpoP